MRMEEGMIQPYDHRNVLPSVSGPRLVLSGHRRRPQRASHQPLKQL